MTGLCGADCTNCKWSAGCKGCRATCGKPFGGGCIAADYIRLGGKDAYLAFKAQLLSEVNDLLASLDAGSADALYELCGAYVNLAYPLPDGSAVKFLDDRKVYLGCQVAFADLGVCYGVVADASFILICRYGRDGADPELLLYRHR